MMATKTARPFAECDCSFAIALYFFLRLLPPPHININYKMPEYKL